MKKIISLVLCLVFVLSFSACGKKDISSIHNVDVEQYIKDGKLSSIGFKLGDDVDEIKSALESTASYGDETSFSEFEVGEYTVMSDGAVTCCYKTKSKKDGITHIVNLYGDYGFAQGTMSTEIRDTMSKLGADADERDAKSGELFFMPSSGNITVLEYAFDENTALFIFEQNSLSAVALYTK